MPPFYVGDGGRFDVGVRDIASVVTLVVGCDHVQFGFGDWHLFPACMRWREPEVAGALLRTKHAPPIPSQPIVVLL